MDVFEFDLNTITENLKRTQRFAGDFWKSQTGQ